MGRDTSVNSSPARRLTVVIPALNEEAAIANTIQRCLDARPAILLAGGLETLEIIVVSDGSTDRTAEIARGFQDVDVCEFSSNRGYGAALKHGFSRGTGDLVGFLDADGTCSPEFFSDLTQAVVVGGADIALGSRVSSESEMPWIRTLGNRLFALLLSGLSNRRVRDTASGMRVMRRDVLSDIGPLPDGLQYTPAMSARAVLKGLRVVELPMPYSARIGESKLSASRDGWRFLQAILDGVLLYRPERLFLVMAVSLLSAALVLSLHPIEFYATHARVEEWMIYRFLVASLLSGAGVGSLIAGALVGRMSELVIARDHDTFWRSVLIGVFRGPSAVGIVLILSCASLALVWPGIREYASTGHVTLHWTRVVVSAFGLMTAFQTMLAAMLLRIVSLWLESVST
ncbi:MAG: glycosyltransferase family 2 protein [Gemmatimonadota bacterium]